MTSEVAPAAVPQPGAPAPSAPRALGGRLGAALLLLPAVVWLVALFLLPLGIIGVISLGSLDSGGHVTLGTPTFGNYVRAFEPEYLPALGKSLLYASATTILSLVIGYPVAYWISRHGGTRKVALLILVMLPFWTSYLIRSYAWMIILRDDGIMNSLLLDLGLVSDPIPILNTDAAVILGMTYGFLPFAILPLFVSIDRLDVNLVQAGRDLYASGRAAFLHVTLPLTMPGIVAAGLLTFIPALGDFVTPDLLGGADTTTIAKIVQVVFTTGHDWPYGSALGILMMAITIVGTGLGLRSLQRELIG